MGKIFGMKQAMKSGIGSASLTLGSGVVVAALVAVNALGDVIDPASGQIVAGARKSADQPASSRIPRRPCGTACRAARRGEYDAGGGGDERPARSRSDQ